MTETIASIQLPKVNIADIEKGLESASKVLPLVATFIPGMAPVIAFLPLIEGGLKLLADVQANWGDPVAVVESVANHLHDIANQVHALKPAAAVAASSAPSTVAIDFQAPTGG